MKRALLVEIWRKENSQKFHEKSVQLVIRNMFYFGVYFGYSTWTFSEDSGLPLELSLEQGEQGALANRTRLRMKGPFNLKISTRKFQLEIRSSSRSSSRNASPMSSNINKNDRLDRQLPFTWLSCRHEKVRRHGKVCRPFTLWSSQPAISKRRTARNGVERFELQRFASKVRLKVWVSNALRAALEQYSNLICLPRDSDRFRDAHYLNCIKCGHFRLKSFWKAARTAIGALSHWSWWIPHFLPRKAPTESPGSQRSAPFRPGHWFICGY